LHSKLALIMLTQMENLSMLLFHQSYNFENLAVIRQIPQNTPKQPSTSKGNLGGNHLSVVGVAVEQPHLTC